MLSVLLILELTHGSSNEHSKRVHFSDGLQQCNDGRETSATKRVLVGAELSSSESDLRTEKSNFFLLCSII